MNTVTAQVFDKAKNVTTKTLPITLDSTAETAYTYDKNGNLIQKSHRGEQTLYSYDYDNMLTSEENRGVRPQISNLILDLAYLHG